MYNFSDLDGHVLSPNSDYPQGNYNDDPDNGTRANVKMFTDFGQFLSKLLAVNGTTPNGLPDNVTNGYQVFDAFREVIQTHIAPALINQIPSYNTSDWYVISGVTNRATDGLVFHNGMIYYVVGNSGSACGGGLVDVLSAPLTNSTKAPFMVNVVCAASGSGSVDFSALKRPFYNTGLLAPTYATSLGIQFKAHGTNPIKCRRTGNTVRIEGMLNANTNTSGINTGTYKVFDLPDASMFPARETFRVVGSAVEAVNSTSGYSAPMTTVQITTGGVVNILADRGNFDTNGVYFDITYEVDVI